jgi:hypothetical protein
MVKRYSHKGFADSMGRIIKGSRARHTWCGSHVRASVSRRRTPVGELREGPVVWQSYFLSEHVSGSSLRGILEQRPTGAAELTEIAGKVCGLPSSILRWRITHGDLQLQTVVIGSDAAISIDPGGIRLHRTRVTYHLAHRRDRTIFRRHIRTCPQFEALYDGSAVDCAAAHGTDSGGRRGRA